MYVCKLYWDSRLIYNIFCSSTETKCPDTERHPFVVYPAVRG